MPRIRPQRLRTRTLDRRPQSPKPVTRSMGETHPVRLNSMVSSAPVFVDSCLFSDKCRPGRTHFEKVTGYEAVGSRTTILRQMPIAVMSSSIANQGGGVLIDCLNFCRTDPRCLGFNYHTINQACYVLEPNDAAATARIDTNIDHIITLKAKPGVIHFTSNCFRGQ